MWLFFPEQSYKPPGAAFDAEVLTQLSCEDPLSEFNAFWKPGAGLRAASLAKLHLAAGAG